MKRKRSIPFPLVISLTVAKLTDWRNSALAGVATAWKKRERDGRDDEIAWLKSKVGYSCASQDCFCQPDLRSC